MFDRLTVVRNMAIAWFVFPLIAGAADFEAPRMKLPPDGYPGCKANAGPDNGIPESVDVTLFLKSRSDLHTFGFPFAPSSKLQRLVRCVVKSTEFRTAIVDGEAYPVRVVVRMAFGPVTGAPTDEIGVLQVGPLTSTPGYIRRTTNPLDCYPIDAGIQHGFQRILAPLVIEPDGSVSSVTVESGSPAWALASARCLAQRMSFLPATADGQAIRTDFTMPVSIQGDDAESKWRANLAPPTLGSTSDEIDAAASACLAPDLRVASEVPVRFVIDADGDAIEPAVIETSGDTRLDSAAICMIRKLRFTPMVQDGKATFPLVTWTVPVRPTAGQATLQGTR